VDVCECSLYVVDVCCYRAFAGVCLIFRIEVLCGFMPGGRDRVLRSLDTSALRHF
jgi:hypothetical protein